MDQQAEIVDALISMGLTWGARVVGVLVAVLIGWMVAGWGGRVTGRMLSARNIDQTVGRFAAGAVRYLILLGVGIGCLGVFGIDTTSFAAALGAAGVAIGLALQGTLSNFAAGVMLLVFRPYKVGDVVSAGGTFGIIEQIDLFTTKFLTLDNRVIIVPNGTIFGGTIENITGADLRRVDIDVGVDYSADIDETRRVLENALAGIPGRLDGEPSMVFLKGLGASSVDWQMRVWCKTTDYWAVYEATIRATKVALDGAGIGIPFPQMDVHLDGSLAS